VLCGKSPIEGAGWGNVDAGGGKRRAMIEKVRTRVPAGRPKGNNGIMKSVEATRPKPDGVPLCPRLPRQGSFIWSS